MAGTLASTHKLPKNENSTETLVTFRLGFLIFIEDHEDDCYTSLKTLSSSGLAGPCK